MENNELGSVCSKNTVFVEPFGRVRQVTVTWTHYICPQLRQCTFPGAFAMAAGDNWVIPRPTRAACAWSPLHR